MWIQKEIYLEPRVRGFHIITKTILKDVPELKNFKIGILQLFIKHTSAALTINENTDSTDFNYSGTHALTIGTGSTTNADNQTMTGYLDEFRFIKGEKSNM